MRSASFTALLLCAVAPITTVDAQVSRADSASAGASVAQFHAALGRPTPYALCRCLPRTS